jgi:chloramphenicol-sensitive protein RarD
MNAPHRSHARKDSFQNPGTGLLLGVGAYGLWGVLPIYFKHLPHVSPYLIVANRVVWSLPFLALLLTLQREWTKFAAVLKDARARRILTISALLVGTNWTLYTYAVTNGHILAASFGYYLNPIANVLLGRFVLGERLGRLQWTAVAIAGAGISVLAAGALGQLWISLTLCITFAIYGLLRKVVEADSLTGLAVETTLLAPVAIGFFLFLLAGGSPVLAPTRFENSLLLFAGIVSTTPLLLFAGAARRLLYSTLGMIQFVAPTLQFLLAVLLYGEHFTVAHGIAFGAIWTALVFYVIALARQPRLPQAAE